MADIIHLLPDSVANQIAAGEVIQRPASAVKELLENAVDAGAEEITLVVKDAGKTLIQVVDNGCGMSETDARMCFERHATSKIKETSDLFAIRTLGFRGEALASIAAIAQVELKTKRVEDEAATMILIEASKLAEHRACAAPNGTSVSVKNLFYNIPARRKFLKSDNAELRHIMEEFNRVALVQPQIRFSLINDGRQLYSLNPGSLKQRIAALFGNNYSNRLIPVESSSEVVKISGFIGKPEFARKTRGEQYFFVNGRFIKHHYLNHAVDAAFKELIPKELFPSYFIYFRIDSGEIDINIHPSKTEVNFQNNQVIYAMLSASVKQALGKFNITPSLDFESGIATDFTFSSRNTPVSLPEVKVNADYSPFDSRAGNIPRKAIHASGSNRQANWDQLYNTMTIEGKDLDAKSKDTGVYTDQEVNEFANSNVFNFGDNLAGTRVKSGLMIIHIQRALERIYFYGFMKSLESLKGISQQLLFPVTYHCSPPDAEILREINSELKHLGFDLEEFGDNTFILNGTPSDLNNVDIKDVLDSIIENYKNEIKNNKIDNKVKLAKSMAEKLARIRYRGLEPEAFNALIDNLFGTDAPEVSPNGEPIVKMILISEIEDLF